MSAPVALRIGVALSLFFGGAASAAPERNEAKAREFIHCAQVSAAVVTLAAQHGDADSSDAFRKMRFHFLLGAAMKSDGDFIQAESPRTLQKLNEQRAADKAFVMKEADRCSQLWTLEIQPLLAEQKARARP